MNILLLGSGGREHAFAWKIKQSTLCSALFIAPGNAVTATLGTNIDISVLDFDAIKTFCEAEKINMVIAGPEDPLVAGIYDYFKNDEELQNILVIGPSKQAAQLEGSKAFSKKFMKRHGIPTASYQAFEADTFAEGEKYLATHTLPIVLKADGLAAGKGVVICESNEEAVNVFTSMIKDRQFGEAGSRVVVEQFLKGIEVSIFVMTDGVDYKVIGHAKDYKRIGEGDTGPNTGGMGCVSPVPFADELFMKKVVERIIKPTIDGLCKEQLVYKGFVFFGLIKVDDEPYLIEYNCRMGDPETEVVLPRLKNDLVALCKCLYDGNLHEQTIVFDSRSCSTVVAVSSGYPGDYKTGFEIAGLEQNAQSSSDTIIFHSGTKASDDKILTNGGRVLAVTSFGNTIGEAVGKSLLTLKNISFKGMTYRKDIGYEFI